MLCIGHRDLYMSSSKLCSGDRQCPHSKISPILLKGGIVVSVITFDAQGNENPCREFNWASLRLSESWAWFNNGFLGRC
jgi:hypothetical protein